MESKELLKHMFREKRVRLSLPRLLVYQAFSKTPTPMSPREVHQRLLKRGKRVGLTSIYRTLDLFESTGILFKIVRGPAIRYKLCELEDHHHHIICKTCGDVVEFGYCDISSLTQKVRRSTGYQVTDHQLNLYGVCKICRKKGKT
jgi:Fur family ferric uptake transcriptional regulator